MLLHSQMQAETHAAWQLMRKCMQYVQAAGTAKAGTLFRFVVEASGQTYQLAALSDAERQQWLQALALAMKHAAAAPMASLASSVAAAAAHAHAAQPGAINGLHGDSSAPLCAPRTRS